MEELKPFIIQEYTTPELAEALGMTYGRLKGIIRDKRKELGLGKMHGHRWMTSQVEKIVNYTGVRKPYRTK